MPILHTRTVENGESASYHEVESLHWEAGAESAFVQLRSWKDKAARDADSPISWSWPAMIPAAAVSGLAPEGIEPILVDEGGALEGGTVLNPSTELEEAKAIRWWQLRMQRDAGINGGFELPGVGVFDSDLNSRTLLTGAVLLAQMAAAAGQPYSVDWTLKDNAVVTLDASDVIAAGIALGNHVAAWHEAGRVARAAIEAAESVEAVNAVDLISPGT